MRPFYYVVIFFQWVVWVEYFADRGTLVTERLSDWETWFFHFIPIPVAAYIYIIANAHNNVLYVGMTVDLKGRIHKHRTKYYPKSFSAKYNVCKLVYYETFDKLYEARARETQLKAGNRKRKEMLIRSTNPEYRDLYDELWY